MPAQTDHASDLAHYLANTYGKCSRNPCECQRQHGPHLGCPSWHPTKATTWQELMTEYQHRGAFDWPTD